MATPVIIEVRANASQAKSQLQGLSNSFKQFGASVRSVVAMSSQAVTGLRQMAQGVQNLGFTMSAMIGIPLAAGLRSITDEALKFERQMVEVQKTTGMASSDVKALSDEIRGLAQTTPTSAVELASLAAEAGRAGVGLQNMLAGNVAGAREEILEFVRVLDMMTVSTTLTAETGATAFGRFMTVFDGIDTSNIENLGSAINELGQASSVSEDEIVGAMMRIAPAASTLGMSAQDVAALATAITQMSESMSRGGTRVRTALEQMGINFQEAAKLIGESTESMKQRLDEDALSVFMELLAALGQVESGVDRLRIATEIFGTTGANAVQRFTGALPELQQFMAISNQAFSEGTSLQLEFNRALNATSEMLKVLRNNLMEVGMQFVNDLLPIAKEIIGALIPAVRELGAWVADLSTKQKLLIAGIAAMVVVGLPLLALLGSLGFGLSMIVNGIVNVVGGLTGLLATILTFGSGVSFIGILLGGLAAVIGIGLVTAALKATGAFDVILAKLQEVARGAFDWGESLIAEIAEGIIQAAATILIQALEFVGNIISSFLESASPPETGPLSTINKWGKRLIDTYLQGFMSADFDVLKSVTGIIEHVLQNLKSLKEIREANIVPMLDSARAKVAKLIDIFNKTGEIAQDVLGEIRDMLGGAGEDIAKLLSLQLRYNGALKELERIRQQKTDVDEAYKAEVRAIMKRTDLTEAEKMQLIRQAKNRKDLALENLDTEQTVAEKNVEGLKSQLEWQQKYIQSQMDTDDLWKQQAKLLESVGKAGSSAARAVKSAMDKLLEQLQKLYEQLENNLKLQELYKQKGMDVKPLLREELSIRQRIVNLLMEKGDLTAAEQKTLDENLDRIKELQSILGTEAAGGIAIPTIDVGEIEQTALSFNTGLDSMKESVKGFSDILSTGQGAWDAFKAGLTGKKLEPKDIIPEGLRDLLPAEDLAALVPQALSESEKKFYEWGQKIFDVKERVLGIVDDIKTKFDDFKSSFTQTAQELGNSVRAMNLGERFEKSRSILVPALLAIGGAILLLKGPFGFLRSWMSLGPALGIAGTAISGLADTLFDLGRVSAGAGPAIARFASGALAAIKAIPGAGAGIKTAFGAALSAITSFIGKSKFMIRFLMVGLSWVKAFPLQFAKWAPGKILQVLIGGLGKVLGLFKLLAGGIIGAGAAIGSFISSIVTFVGTIVAVGGTVLAVIAAVGAAVYYIIDNWEKFQGIFISIWNNIKAAVSGFVSGFAKALGLGSTQGIKFADVLKLIYEKAEPVAKFLAGAFTKALLVLSGLFKIVLPAVGKALGGIIRGILAFAAGVLDTLGGIFGVLEALWNVLTGKGDWSAVGDALKDVGKGILEMFGGIGIAVGNVLSGLVDIVLGIFSSVLDGIVNLFGQSKFLKGVSDFIEGVVNWFQWLYEELLGGSIIPDIVEGISRWFKRLTAPFRFVIGLLSKLIKFFKDAAKYILGAFKSGGETKGIAAIVQVFGPLAGIVKPIIDVFTSLYKVITPLFNAFKQGFASGGLVGAFEALKKVIPSVLGSMAKLIGNLMTMVPKMLIALGKLFIQYGLPAISGFVQAAWEYLKSNVPKWIDAILSGLSVISSGLWGWVQDTVIPWVTSFVATASDYLRENLPVWWDTLSEVLGTLATNLWAWITETVIPWAIGMFNSIIETVMTKGPEWLMAVGNLLRDIGKKLSDWVRTEAVPAIRDFINDGLIELARIGTDWLEKISQGLEDVKQKFKDIFDQIKNIIVNSIKAGINKMLGAIESGVNRVVDGINDFISKINALAATLGLSGLPKLRHISIKRLAEGGIITSPIMAILGEAGDEAVIPLNRLETMMGDMAGRGPAHVEINIHNPTVRNDDDMQRIIDVIQRQLGLQLNTKYSLLGRGMSY